MTKHTNTRLAALCLIIPTLALLSACGGGSDSPTVPQPTDSVLTTSIVDGNGGTVRHAEISLEVPAGAFAAPTEISLVRLQDNPTGDELSPAFRIDGLPIGYAEPLTVVFPGGKAAGDRVFLLGEKAFISSLNKVTTHFFPITAAVTDSTVSVVLPATPPVPTGKSVEGITSVVLTEAVEPHTHVTGAGHFAITYLGNAVSPDDIVALGTYLEEAYDKFLGLGFSYAARTSWPVSVAITLMEPTKYGVYANSKLGNNHGTISFNALLIRNRAEMRVTAGHEFFHLVQSFHDPRWFWPKATSRPLHHWLNEAMAVWSENGFSDDPAYESVARDGVEGSPYEGLETGQLESPDAHGYGLSALIRYLVGENGPSVLPRIYSYIDLEYSGTGALDQAIGDLPIWWDDFLLRYTRGEIHPMTAGDLLGLRSGEFKINSESDTNWSISPWYGDLSGRLFKISMTDTNLPAAANLDLAVTGSQTTIHAFSYDRAGLYQLGTGRSSINVPGLRDIQAADRGLIVLVSQSRAVPDYLSSEQITLTAVVNRPTVDLSGFDQAIVRLCVEGDFLLGDGTTEQSVICITDFWGRNLVITGTSFTCDLDQNFQYGSYVQHSFGQLTGTLSDDLTRIVQFTCTLNRENIFSDHTEAVYTSTISADGLGLELNEPTSVRWSVRGTGACAAISDLQYNYVLGDRLLTGHSCGEFSYVEVSFQ